MSLILFSVRMGIRMEVPKKPVCRQLPCSSKFLRRRFNILSLAGPWSNSFLRANKIGVCIVLRISALNSPLSLKKRFNR